LWRCAVSEFGPLSSQNAIQMLVASWLSQKRLAHHLRLQKFTGKLNRFVRGAAHGGTRSRETNQILAVALLPIPFGPHLFDTDAESTFQLHGISALVATPLVFLALFRAKLVSEIVGLFPTVKAFKYQREEGLYFTLMMSTGLTFGTISALGVIRSQPWNH